MLGLLGDVHHLGHRHLHPERQLKSLNARIHASIVLVLGGMLPVGVADEVELHPLQCGVSLCGLEVAKLGPGHWGFRVAKGRALVGCGEKGRSIVLCSTMHDGWANGHEPRKVPVFVAQSVDKPGTHAWAGKDG